MASIGQNLDTLASLDSGQAVVAGNVAAGASKDIGAPASPQPTEVAAQFSITNAGSTDGYDLEVLVQFSDDDSNWPDAGEGLPLASFFSAGAGDDLTRSPIFVFKPRLRYFRFYYINANGTDDLSVSSEEATHITQYVI